MPEADRELTTTPDWLEQSFEEARAIAPATPIIVCAYATE